MIDLRGQDSSTLQALLGDRHWTGRGVPLEQGAAIVRGEPLFAADVRRPGQQFGRVLRAPASPELESRLVAFEERAAQAVPGFTTLVQFRRLLSQCVAAEAEAAAVATAPLTPA